MHVPIIAADMRSAYRPPLRSNASSGVSHSSSSLYAGGGVGLTTGRYEDEPTTPMAHPSGIMEGRFVDRCMCVLSLYTYCTLKQWYTYS